MPYTTCACMILDGPNGEDVCRRCRQDFHACDCPAIHHRTCEFAPQEEVEVKYDTRLDPISPDFDIRSWFD